MTTPAEEGIAAAKADFQRERKKLILKAKHVDIMQMMEDTHCTELTKKSGKVAVVQLEESWYLVNVKFGLIEIDPETAENILLAEEII